MDSPSYGQNPYLRRDFDAYFTEHWITRLLLSLEDIPSPVWEPACGRGDMVRVIEESGLEVVASDVQDHGFGRARVGVNFLDVAAPPCGSRFTSIVTNPPYLNDLSAAFAGHGLEIIRRTGGALALLMRADWDAARNHRPLVSAPEFAAKIQLLKRPRWDWWEQAKPMASPRFNYAWYVWRSGAASSPGGPTIRFAHPDDLRGGADGALARKGR